jgi:hypothetical protein
MLKNRLSQMMVCSVFCLVSQTVLAEVVHFEFEVKETKAGGKQWDGASRYFGADPAPDIYGKIKILSGEICEIGLHENAYLAQQDCQFTGALKEGDKFSLEIFDKDSLRRDDIIFSGAVTFEKNPTVVDFTQPEQLLKFPPESGAYLKTLKIELKTEEKK